MKNTISELKKILTASIRNKRAEGLLFSGGLDSAIIACVQPDIKAITVNFKSYGKDPSYATAIAKHFGIEHYKQSVETEEAVSVIPEVIKILNTFDPAIPNDIVVYFALKKARELGIKQVSTGDASDELFGGYSFMQGVEELDKYIKKIASSLVFSSNELSNFFNIELKQPYADQGIIDFAFKIKKDLKIRHEGDRLWGKWILRKAFEGALPGEFVWQDKRPLEYGSGMTNLREIITAKVTDNEFEEAKRECQVKFMNKEHFYYYRIYDKVVGKIPDPKADEKACPGCGAGIKPGSFHCKVCGYVLNWRL